MCHKCDSSLLNEKKNLNIPTVQHVILLFCCKTIFVSKLRRTSCFHTGVGQEVQNNVIRNIITLANFSRSRKIPNCSSGLFEFKLFCRRSGLLNRRKKQIELAKIINTIRGVKSTIANNKKFTKTVCDFEHTIFNQVVAI